MDLERLFQTLAQDGAAVLEGVAGVGKTHAITQTQYALAPDITFLSKDALKKTIETTLDAYNKREPGDNVPDFTSIIEDQGKNQACNIKTTLLSLHPSTSYEEMIGGLRPFERGGDPLRFEWQPGRILKAILEACDCLENGCGCKHLIVLDEINRCNLPSVLGELIFLIEPSRRVSKDMWDKHEKSRDCLLNHFYAIHVGPLKGGEIVYIPDNLYFLGTMNSSDRSILGFDQALRRRFPPYRMEPMNLKDLTACLEKASDKAIVEKLRPMLEAWAALNVFLRTFIGVDAMIGHSYWFNAVERHGGDPSHAWEFGILPQAIHAAESARQEGLLAELFKRAFTDKDDKGIPAFRSEWLGSWEDDNALGAIKKSSKECFGEDYKLNGLDKVLRHLAGKLGKAKVTGRTVSLVGSGHGEKLIITEVPPP